MEIEIVEQGSEEWFASRLGKATASHLADIVPGRNGYTKARDNYLSKLVCERLTGDREDSYTSPSMQWGTDTEPLARSAYEVNKGVSVDEVGFIEHPTIENFGASPDGLIGEDGGLEIKCPNTATHISTLTGAPVKKEYVLQMAAGMMCTGREWWDFVSYDPRMPDNLSFFCKRFFLKDMDVDNIEMEVRKFLAELDALEEKLRGMK